MIFSENCCTLFRIMRYAATRLRAALDPNGKQVAGKLRRAHVAHDHLLL